MATMAAQLPKWWLASGPDPFQLENGNAGKFLLRQKSMQLGLRCCAKAAEAVDMVKSQKKTVLVMGGTGRVGASTLRALAKGRKEKPWHVISAAMRSFQALIWMTHLLCEQLLMVGYSALTWGADLVVHAAGPFQRRAECAVLEAAIDTKTAYIDVCDDEDYSVRAKAYHDRAVAAQIPAITTAGIYPGVSNIMAAELVRLNGKPKRIRYSYYTAGSGGAGPTILATSFLLLGEETVVYVDDSAQAYGKEVQVPNGGRVQCAIAPPIMKEEPTTSKQHTLGEADQSHNLQPLPTCFNNRAEEDQHHSSMLQPQLAAVRPQQTVVQHNQKLQEVRSHEEEEEEDVTLQCSTRCKRGQAVLEAKAFFEDTSHFSEYNNSSTNNSSSEGSYNRSWRSEESTNDESSVYSEDNGSDLCKKKEVQVRVVKRKKTPSAKKTKQGKRKIPSFPELPGSSGNEEEGQSKKGKLNLEIGEASDKAIWSKGEGAHIVHPTHNTRQTSKTSEVIKPSSFVSPLVDVIQKGSKPKKKNTFTTTKSSWTDEALHLAIQAIEEGHKIQHVSDFYHIPRTSLVNHADGKRTSRKRGRQGTLTKNEEAALLQYLDNMVEWGLPLTTNDLKEKVAEMVQGRPNPFTNGIPGASWMKWFRKRNPQYTLRVAQGLEVNRAKGLCPPHVKTFYDNLATMYSKHTYSSDQIWNVDESGAQAGRGGGRVLARKGTKTIHSLVAGQREFITVLSAINAGGETIPNFYIFKGLHRMRDYISLCEKDATMAMQPNA